MGTTDRKKSEAVKRDEPLSLRSLTRAQVLELLAQSGSKLATAEALGADQAAGLPHNGDESIDLMALAAWLVRETKP